MLANLAIATQNVGLPQYLTLGAILFVVGLIGVLVRRNTLVILMSIELMLNAVNVIMVAFSRFSGTLDGQINVFFVMAIAASEAAIGLALAVSIFRQFKGINIRFFENLKG
ncbi:MAG: NADH-quinone oxidoreductase subunit NuoK [Bdellovibrionales bacterium CG10_big_fil_rev_8_21_14_0_10_45_34]|nr:MAG: NADH-quinone oxidoreductase subunit NuoK [Bdellovibrionales bacterium CG10_big_fil_rev_8_21_14_0_10_45_34]